MRGLLSILSLFRNEFNKFNNTGVQMLDSLHVSHDIKLLKYCIFGVKTSRFSLSNATFYWTLLRFPKICKPLFLHGCLFVSLFTPIVKWTKTHVQIRRFTCCLKMGLKFKILKMRPALIARCYIQKALRTRLVILRMLLFAKTLRTVMTLWWRYDVQKYTEVLLEYADIVWNNCTQYESNELDKIQNSKIKLLEYLLVQLS